MRIALCVTTEPTKKEKPKMKEKLKLRVDAPIYLVEWKADGVTQRETFTDCERMAVFVTAGVRYRIAFTVSLANPETARCQTIR